MTPPIRRPATLAAALCALVLLALAACAPPPRDGGPSPLLSVSQTSAHPSRAVIVVPGALASIRLYRDVYEWNLPDTEYLGYRFPGYDGLALDHRLDIAGAGRAIAAHVRRKGYGSVYLIGYSTGGPVALEAAMQLGGEVGDLRVALLSTAAPAPASIVTGIRGAGDLFDAATRAQSLEEQALWSENFRTLLYGRRHYSVPFLAARTRAWADAVKGRLETPKEGLGAAHVSGLVTWRPSAPERLEGARVAFFHGTEDPVFSEAVTRRFAARIGADRIKTYAPGGHLLFLTHPCVLPDIRAFFDTGEIPARTCFR